MGRDDVPPAAGQPPAAGRVVGPDAVGWIIANGLAYGARQLPAFIQQLKTLTIQPSVTVALLVISVLIGVASSFVPAYKASRTTILDALRYNG